MKRLIALSMLIFALNSYATETVNTQMKTSVSNKDAKLSAMWGISESEYQEYQNIMAGPRGTFSPGIAPPLALALEAKTDSERKRFLKIFAKLEYERTANDLLTAKLYNEVFTEMYSEPFINKSELLKGKNYILEEDSFVIFIDASCNDCKINLSRDLLRTSSFPNNPTDIYVKNIFTDPQLRRWAGEHGINPMDVQEGKVTLNLLGNNAEHILDNSVYKIYVRRNFKLFNLKD